MSPHGEQLIRRTWALIEERRETFESSFLDCLGTLAPDLSAMMREAAAHLERGSLVAILGELVECAAEPRALLLAAAAMGERLGELGIARPDYEIVGSALIRTLEQELGARLSPEAKRAWRELLGVAAGAMQRASGWRGNQNRVRIVGQVSFRPSTGRRNHD